MNLEEHAAKPVLESFGIRIPKGRLAANAIEATAAANDIGPCVVKAQVPTGKRGKAGGIRVAQTPPEAAVATEAILGMDIGGFTVAAVLIEQQAAIARELYAAVLNDPVSKGPLAMLSAAGGMDVEEAAESHPDAMRSVGVAPGKALTPEALATLTADMSLGAAEAAVREFMTQLYRAYDESDAELLEVNPLAVLDDDTVMALDCKFTLDDSSVPRQSALAERGTPDPLTALEARARDLGLKYIELDGDIGVLANGAGLTMTTMDVIAFHGGRPANFLEIGGESYTLAKPALELVLGNPGVKSLVVNFCGAFARTDVMTQGVIDAWEALAPSVPAFYCVHGTGSAEARQMLRERLQVEPYATMDEAIVAAIAASRGGQGQGA
ncbi:MAG: succinate--CoA ligase subunit beta [Gammaproteobacteria bacterium]